MKTCPVCGAVAFDDAEICYGCLYRFGEEGSHAEIAPTAKEPSSQASARKASGFLIKLVPLDNPSSDVVWACEVEAVC